MNASPLQLNAYYFKEIAVKWNPDIDTAEKIIADDLIVNVNELQDQDNPRKWIFELTIELPESQTPKSPYIFRVLLVGFFDVVDTYSADLADKLARANGPALLYSAAREILAILSCRTFGSTLMLPSVNFLPSTNQQANSEEGKTTKRVSKVKRAKRPSKKSA